MEFIKLTLILAYLSSWFASIRSQITIIESKWDDDFLCDSSITQWSNCKYIDDSNDTINTQPLYHGPYSYFNSSDILLSRPFECKFNSQLRVSFYAGTDYLSDLGDELVVSLTNNYQYDILINNETDTYIDSIWNAIYVEINDVKVIQSETFTLTFSIERNDEYNDDESQDSQHGQIVFYNIQIQCIPPTRWSSVGFFNLRWSSIISIVYFSLYALILFCIAVRMYIKNDYHGFSNLFQRICKMRQIYGSVMVHLYDTATDIGVMVDWWFLAQDEKHGIHNYEELDMSNLFWTSVGVLSLYRFVSIIIVAKAEKAEISNPFRYIFYVTLSVFDMYIIKTVWVAVNKDDDKPTPRQRLVQFMESMCESLPQILLQTVFIIRGFNDPYLRENSSVYLVSISLSASFLSVTNRYIWLDRPCFYEKWRHSQLKLACPCINIRWLLRMIWRFAMITNRFVAFALIWVVLGGAFLPMYCVMSFIIWSIFYCHVDVAANSWDEREGSWLMASVISIASNLATDDWRMPLLRIIEHGGLLAMLYWFAFDESMECPICADNETRQASNNIYILLFIFAGLCALGIEVILSFVFYVLDCCPCTNYVFEDNSRKAFDALQAALGDITLETKEELEHAHRREIDAEFKAITQLASIYSDSNNLTLNI